MSEDLKELSDEEIYGGDAGGGKTGKDFLMDKFKSQGDRMSLAMGMTRRQLRRMLYMQRTKKPRKPSPKGRASLIARQKKGRPIVK